MGTSFEYAQERIGRSGWRLMIYAAGAAANA